MSFAPQQQPAPPSDSWFDFFFSSSQAVKTTPPPTTLHLSPTHSEPQPQFPDNRPPTPTKSHQRAVTITGNIIPALTRTTHEPRSNSNNGNGPSELPRFSQGQSSINPDRTDPSQFAHSHGGDSYDTVLPIEGIDFGRNSSLSLDLESPRVCSFNGPSGSPFPSLAALRPSNQQPPEVSEEATGAVHAAAPAPAPAAPIETVTEHESTSGMSPVVALSAAVTTGALAAAAAAVAAGAGDAATAHVADAPAVASTSVAAVGGTSATSATGLGPTSHDSRHSVSTPAAAAAVTVEDLADAAPLRLDLNPDELVFMSQVGHLRQWCPATRHVQVHLSQTVPHRIAAESLRLLYLFPQLQRLELRLSDGCRLGQHLAAAIAELAHLDSVTVLGGRLATRGLDLGVLRSIRGLTRLHVMTREGSGMDDDHMHGLARLTALRSLCITGCADELTDEGMGTLSGLSQLTSLSLLPLGNCVTRHLDVGLHDSHQASILAEVADVSELGLVVDDAAIKQGSFFSMCSLVLRASVVSLRLHTLCSADPHFLLAIGTLTALTELKMGVALVKGQAPYTCNLGVLSTLGRLRSLDFAVTAQLRLPLSVKLVSTLALSWPHLTALSLGVMGKEEVQPEALLILDNFPCLQRLSLFAPLDHDRADTPVLDPSSLVSILLSHLPQRLTHITLEGADIRLCSSTQRTSSSLPPDLDPSATDAWHFDSHDYSTQAASHAAGGMVVVVVMNDCCVCAGELLELLESTRALTHLELNEVTGIDDSVMAALRPLTALLHLSITAMEAPGVTNCALASLAGVAALRHLEWAVGDGLSAQELLTPGGGCDILSRVGTLRFLSLFVAEDVNERVVEDEGRSRTLERSGGAVAGLAVKGGQRNGDGIRSLYEAGGRVGGLGREVGWKAWLQSALPLCHVTHLPAMSKYSVWDDSTSLVVNAAAEPVPSPTSSTPAAAPVSSIPASVVSPAAIDYVKDTEFSITKISYGNILTPLGVGMLTYGFGAYFLLLPGADVAALLLIYGFPISVLGFALSYAQLDPVACLTTPEAFALREAQMTDNLKQIREDTTRFRYGDEQHLEEAVEKIFKTGKSGGLQRKLLPRLKGLREEVTAGAYTLVLEFTSNLSDKEWESRLPKFQSFFGPGVVANLSTSPTGRDISLVVDGSGAGRGGEQKKDQLPPLMPGLKGRVNNLD
ncbi:MAG: hypothetical protein WDW36_003188 [Sanguina aurantia]